MLMQLGISPDLTQAAYRVGDSSTNIITPLMPYFPLIVVFCQNYVKAAGIGTLLAMMLPYSLTLLVGWTAFLVGYWALGLPLGIRPATATRRADRRSPAQVQPAAVPAQEVEKFPTILRTVGHEMRFGTVRILHAAAGNAVDRRALLNFREMDVVGLGRVEPEHLGAQRRGDFRIAVLLAQLLAIWKVRNAWIWSCGEPYQMESVPHSTLFSPQVLQQLAQGVRRAVRIAHQKAPGAAQLGIDVAVGRHPLSISERTSVNRCRRAWPRGS